MKISIVVLSKTQGKTLFKIQTSNQHLFLPLIYIITTTTTTTNSRKPDKT